MTTVMERSFKYLDERLGSASLARATLRKVFPDHCRSCSARSPCSAWSC